MPQPPKPPRRFIAPHPAVTMIGIGCVFVMFALGRVVRFENPYIWIVIGVSFTVIFSSISRRSARHEAAKRDRELEELKHKRVFDLDEE